jgi:ATP-binding cassette subfamily B protein
VTPAVDACAWPLSRLDEAIELLARRVGHAAGSSGAARASVTPLATATGDRHAFGRAIARLLQPHGLDVDAGRLRHDEAGHLPAPSIVRLPDTDGAVCEPRFFVVAGQSARGPLLLGHDRRWRRVDARACADALRQAVEAPQRAGVEALLDAAAVRAARRRPVARALLDETLRDRDTADVWRVAVEPGAGFAWQLRRAGVLRQAVLFVALHAAQLALWMASWILIGRGALEGRTEWGWLTAWALIIATMVLLQLWAAWLQGLVAVAAGRLLKTRLLTGALRLEPDEIRHQGAGQLLGRVLESDAVEALAVGGGLQAVLAVVELAMAAAVLAVGAAGTWHLALLLGCSLAAAAGAWTHHRRRRRWSAARLAMTHDLVERLAGHRTRLAQEAGERWHADEDRDLEDYVVRSQAMDAQMPALLIGLPRGWTVLAIAAMAPALLSGAPASALAISLGGVLLTALALRRIGEGLSQLSGAAVAWAEARPLFEAAARRPPAATLDVRPASDERRESATLELRDVAFQYPGRSMAVLRGCTLAAAAGDRVLLQGPSGGGKSTLASLVAGLREPTSGSILVDGLDRRTLGASGWRAEVVTAPQFHENHVLSETFAFNLLMGRQWPPSDADLDAAEAIARELGLGDLIDRMPAGLLQMVGEGGWQLSHGERSRLFMARSLLQGGGVLILDESFAALDPASLRDALECVLRRAPTLVVIAHP